MNKAAHSSVPPRCMRQHIGRMHSTITFKVKDNAVQQAKTRLLCMFVSLLLVISPVANASITMTGNRVIYPAAAKSTDVQLRNPEAIPYVVQSWFDDGDPDSSPQTGKAPFSVTPPMLRMAPQSSQLLRIVYTGDKGTLPQDRESVFYFNFLQIPPANMGDAQPGKNNALVILLRNRVKLFYRPANLPVRPQGHAASLAVSVTNKAGYQVTVDNPNPWFASIATITLTQGTQQWKVKATDMVMPFSSHTWAFPKARLNPNESITVSIQMVNDQGGAITHDYVVSLSS